MNERIRKEIALLKKHFIKIDFVEDGQGVLIKDYQIPADLPWNRKSTDVCFKILEGYPGTPPYGFYVPKGILYDNHVPDSYKESPDDKPSFPGEWGFFSWVQENWQPTADLVTGSNLLNFVMSFRDRFLEGK